MPSGGIGTVRSGVSGLRVGACRRCCPPRAPCGEIRLVLEERTAKCCFTHRWAFQQEIKPPSFIFFLHTFAGDFSVGFWSTASMLSSSMTTGEREREHTWRWIIIFYIVCFNEINPIDPAGLHVCILHAVCSALRPCSNPITTTTTSNSLPSHAGVT